MNYLFSCEFYYPSVGGVQKVIQEIAERLVKKGHKVTIATSALPDEVELLFSNTVSVGKQFGVIVVVEEGITFEVATLRTDSKTSDGRRPDSVEFTKSLRSDAARRDFTINAMFFDPTMNIIIDFFQLIRKTNRQATGNHNSSVWMAFLSLANALPAFG